MLSFYLSMLDDEQLRTDFEIIYNEYRELMYYAASRILGDTNDSEDVVHQAFMKILDMMDDIDEPKSPDTRAQAVIITQHFAIDLYRRRRKRTLVPFDVTDRRYSLDEAAADIANAGPVETAILRLPDRYRNVILLKYNIGYSNAELAKMLDMSEENVKKTVQRAKNKLKKLLAEEGYYDT